MGKGGIREEIVGNVYSIRKSGCCASKPTMRTAKELSLGYLRSRNAGEALEELKALDLSLPIDGFIERYNQHYHHGHPRAVSPTMAVKNVLNVLVPILGNPTSYEISVNRGWDLTTNKYKEESIRQVSWKTKDIQQMLICCDMLSRLPATQTGVGRFIVPDYYTTRREIKIFVPMDCFIPVLLKSDDPAYWVTENARKYKQLMERRKIGAVTKRLDR